jgi:threonine/homoserine/homoserine lactone efflux protein
VALHGHQVRRSGLPRLSRGATPSHAQGTPADDVTLVESHLRLFATGAASNISNPKIAVFYFAFLPQFVTPNARAPTVTIFALGLVFAVLTFVIKGPVAMFAGRLSCWFRTRPAALLGLYRLSGLVMIGLAVRLALTRRD